MEFIIQLGSKILYSMCNNLLIYLSIRKNFSVESVHLIVIFFINIINTIFWVTKMIYSKRSDSLRRIIYIFTILPNPNHHIEMNTWDEIFIFRTYTILEHVYENWTQQEDLCRNCNNLKLKWCGSKYVWGLEAYLEWRLVSMCFCGPKKQYI